MKDIAIGALVLIWFCVGLLILVTMVDEQPKQLHNPYWPFSVETSIKDR